MREGEAVVALRSRGQTYGVIAGVVVGMLVAGLLVPLAFGDTPASNATAGGPAALQSTGGAGGASPTTAIAGDGSTTPTTGPLGATAEGAAPGASVASSGDGGAGAPAPGDGQPLTASDVGVTPTTIKVGFVLLDLTTAHTVGLAPENYSPEIERRAYQAFVDDLNRRGGVAGRQIEPYFATADPFRRDSAQAACLALTKDAGVFAVLALPGYTAGVLCVVKQNATPLIFNGFVPQEFFEQAAGLLVTELQHINRMMFDLVGELDAQGLLDGSTIGVLSDEDNSNGGQQAGDAAVAALEQHGVDVAYRTRLSANLQSGASQIPLEVQQMRAAGVDTIVFATNFLYANQFVQQAQAQGWRPRYFLSDFQGLTADSLVRNMPASFDGALALTAARSIYEAREGMPEPGVDKGCRELYVQATGDDVRYGETHPVLTACDQVRLFERIAGLVGPNLTRAGWIDAVQRVGSFDRPGMFGGSYAPGKFDYADLVRPLHWEFDCRCWRTAGPPRAVRF